LTKNKIFIFEFVSGGGFNQTIIPTSLFCEGFGMLRCIIEDLKALDFEITTMLDSRIYFLYDFLQADIIRKVEKNNTYLKIFKDLIIDSKYVFIIAPETSGILYKLTKIAKNHNRTILSTNLQGIKYGTSKILTSRIFKKYNISTPKTFRIPFQNDLLDLDFILHKFRKLNCPIVIKPEDGVGAESLHYFETKSQILEFFTGHDIKIDKKSYYVLQEYIEGRDLSLSLIGSPFLFENPLLLSVNSQNININYEESEYLGGYTPYENYKKIIEKISSILKKVKFLEIEGYFGIDFIEQSSHYLNFIEINPRLTTSYIGLRNILKYNCAELIFNSKINNIINFVLDFNNYSFFTRIDFLHNKFENLELVNEELIPKLMKLIPEFVTPPISLSESNQYSCFIATKTKDLQSSKIRFNKIIQVLENLGFNIIKPKKLRL
jgi:predicted ATP-grasp superfamily ATP-dependent carboligase